MLHLIFVIGLLACALSFSAGYHLGVRHTLATLRSSASGAVDPAKKIGGQSLAQVIGLVER
jgi:hypothetical protein